ncbi:glycosyl transferase [Dyella nitratireducens]|nr:glycosyl transferase [Dyella nitratireducens]
MTDIPGNQLPPELWTTANAMRRGRAVALCLQSLRSTGFRPDVIYGHPGWGDMLHVRDVFPEARVINYCEFYFNREGQDIGFDPEFQADVTDTYRVRTDNMTQLASLIDADAGISPTVWQRSRYPDLLRRSISVIHDGIDLDAVHPDPAAELVLPQSLLRLDRHTPVITYVARNLEPYRGFHVFMRALPAILKAVPNAHVVMVGGDDVSYSKKPAQGGTYRELMLNEVGARLDLSHVHFLGRVSYAQYLRVLQVSSVHVYLTYPFVLSWSILEAMAMGTVVVASRTAPVQEVIEDGINGHLVDFFSHQDLAETVSSACLAGGSLDLLRQAAQQTVAKRFDLRKSCLSQQLALLHPAFEAAILSSSVAQ